MKSKAAVSLGRKGGKVRSEAKRLAVTANLVAARAARAQKRLENAMRGEAK